MRTRRVIALGITEALERRHLDAIGTGAVPGPVPAVIDLGTRRCEEGLRVTDPCDRIGHRFGQLIEALGQSIDLLDIEHPSGPGKASR